MSEETELDPVQQACDEYMDFINSGDFCEDRIAKYEQAIVEAAMQFYCPGWQEIINKRLGP